MHFVEMNEFSSSIPLTLIKIELKLVEKVKQYCFAERLNIVPPEFFCSS